MKTSKRGIELIKQLEGCELTAYKCSAGVLTIGYGHTGKDVTDGLTITGEKAETLLREDLQKFEKAVEKYVKVELNQNQFDALVSLAYNIGSGSFSKSTLLKKLNAGDYTEAAEQFLVWNKMTVNGVKKESDGLKNRRQKERELFLNPVVGLVDEADVPEGALKENANGTVNVYDANNNKVGEIPKEEAEAAATVITNPKGSYMVKVTCGALRIRKEPNTNSKVAGVIRDKGVYTIVQEDNGWGKLKSGAGWICLKYAEKV